MSARGANVCNLCGVDILWARMPSGKAMPVDRHPSPEGTVAIHRDVQGRTVGRVITADDPAAPYERTHVTHFATCKVYAERQQQERTLKAAQQQTPGVVVAGEFGKMRTNRSSTQRQRQRVRRGRT